MKMYKKIDMNKDYQLADSFCSMRGYMPHPPALQNCHYHSNPEKHPTLLHASKSERVMRQKCQSKFQTTVYKKIYKICST